tara:strand:- start:806 stop:1012 length:207 start_codon:yes stop_codon:yes gene_type:complete
LGLPDKNSFCKKQKDGCMNNHKDKKSYYQKDSLTFVGATSLGILAFTKHKAGAEKWMFKLLVTVLLRC